MKYPIIQFPRKMFYTSSDNTLSCEASDMGNRHLQPLGNGDFGFAITNGSQVANYRLQRPVKDDEGEIRFWEFRLTPESHVQFPDWAYEYVMVDND